MIWLFPSAALALPSIDAPLKTGATAPTDAAVVVGIEDYYELPDVPYAERDAQAFADFLLYTRGVASDRIARVDKANREKLLSAVEDAAAQAGSEGTVWVYFAGHGGASPETGERVLMGIDVQPDLQTFTARSVTVAEVRQAATAEGSKVVLVLDTCYTGQGRTGTDLLPGKRFAVPSFVRSASPDVLEWSAASANQFSGPIDAVQHGAFTYAVIGALRGWADGQLDDERDGVVTAEEAKLYVEEALRSMQIRDQVPVLAVDAPRDWTLASHAKSEDRPTLEPPKAVPPPAPAAVAPAPGAVAGGTPGGTASGCFKRAPNAAGSATGMNIEVDGVVVALVKNGRSACIDLPTGPIEVDVYLKIAKNNREDLSVNLTDGEEALFLMGVAGPGIRLEQVTEAQYAEGKTRTLNSL